MSWKNKVIWSEGLFLQPQHFQQQNRFTEDYVESRSGSLRSYSWGFTELTVDQDLLAIGKVAIASAKGVFADGTPFNIPENDDPPPPLDIGEDARNSIVYLSLATRRPGAIEVSSGTGDDEGLMRYQVREHEVPDVTRDSESSALMQVGTLRTKLLRDQDQRSEYACLGIAHVVEARVDKQVVLDDSYIVPVLDVQAAATLAGFLSELQGLLHHRAESLAGRVSDAGKGAAEIADFLLLQIVNRSEPFIAHLAAGHLMHPEDLYRILLGLAGELATFTSTSKRPGQFPTYRHEELKSTFEPVMTALRDSLTSVLEQTAILLPLKDRRYGIRVAQLGEPGLVDTATFVLAVSADLPVEQIQQRLPAQLKIGHPNVIKDLVNLQLPGIAIRPLPVAPRQIPFHAGHVYFELDRAGDHWPGVRDSGAFAMHVGGDIPGIELEFWAIRSK
jgi:type VI secretion system protein ImpJ